MLADILGSRDLAAVVVAAVTFLLIYFPGHGRLKAQYRELQLSVDRVADDVSHVAVQTNNRPPDAPTIQDKLDTLVATVAGLEAGQHRMAGQLGEANNRLADGTAQFGRIEGRLTSVEAGLFRVATPGVPGGKRASDPPN